MQRMAVVQETGFRLRTYPETREEKPLLTTGTDCFHAKPLRLQTNGLMQAGDSTSRRHGDGIPAMGTEDLSSNHEFRSVMYQGGL